MYSYSGHVLRSTYQGKSRLAQHIDLLSLFTNLTALIHVREKILGNCILELYIFYLIQNYSLFAAETTKANRFRLNKEGKQEYF